jgi:hypothetical protein
MNDSKYLRRRKYINPDDVERTLFYIKNLDSIKHYPIFEYFYDYDIDQNLNGYGQITAGSFDFNINGSKKTFALQAYGKIRNNDIRYYVFCRSENIDVQKTDWSTAVNTIEKIQTIWSQIDQR